MQLKEYLLEKRDVLVKCACTLNAVERIVRMQELQELEDNRSQLLVVQAMQLSQHK